MLVTLIAHTNDPEKTIAAAAKLCYSDAHIETLLDLSLIHISLAPAVCWGRSCRQTFCPPYG